MWRSDRTRGEKPSQLLEVAEIGDGRPVMEWRGALIPAEMGDCKLKSAGACDFDEGLLSVGPRVERSMLSR